jgi:hypothetical protein
LATVAEAVDAFGTSDCPSLASPRDINVTWCHIEFKCGSNSIKFIFHKPFYFESTSGHVVDLVNFMTSGLLQKQF